MRENFKDFVETGSEEEKLLDRLDFAKLPRHIAVIMDGNGRWARSRNLPRVEGHKAGTKAVQEVVETCARLGIEYLTLYAFSKENWKRPKNEIAMLWKLLENYLKEEHNVLIKNKLRLKVIGQKEGLPRSVLRELKRVENLTKNFERMTIVLALNYGGRAEIIEAMKKLCRENSDSLESLDEKIFGHYLYTADIPDPDRDIQVFCQRRDLTDLRFRANIPRIYPQSIRSPFQTLESQPVIEMDIGNERDIHLFFQLPKSDRGILIRNGQPDDLASCFLQTLYLP